LLTHSIPFTTDYAPEFFAAFPTTAAVFVLRASDTHAEPYIGKSSNLRKRLQRLLAPPESQSKRLNLRERVAVIEYTLTGSDFESTLVLYKALRAEFPQTWQKRLRLHHAPLIRLNLDNEYARAYVTNRLGRLTGHSVYYGPFRSRAVAEKFMNDSLDLFKMRRCTFDLNPDPAYPGCVYSEMKMCLAPCFQGCTDEAYAAEVARAQAWFDSGGESLIAEIEAERDRLSADLDFEAAAERHMRINKIKGVASLSDEICRRLDRLDAVIIQPANESKSVSLFRFCRGEMIGPENFSVEAEAETEGSAPTPDQRLRECLARLTPAGARSAAQFMEELAMLKRWYYRTHKTGEIVLTKPGGDLSIRRIANAVTRVSRHEKPATKDRENPDAET
jgi:excinuclease ABC subunit C